MVNKDHTNLVSNTHVYPPSIAVNFCLFVNKSVVWVRVEPQKRAEEEDQEKKT